MKFEYIVDMLVSLHMSTGIEIDVCILDPSGRAIDLDLSQFYLPIILNSYVSVFTYHEWSYHSPYPYITVVLYRSIS